MIVRSRSASVVAVAAVLALSGCATPGAPASSVPTAPRTIDAAPTPTVAANPPSLVTGLEPASVRIEALELDLPLIPLGIAAGGTMEVPADYDEVGWFTGGGRPGGYGPTVIAGHVDSPTGPAVFVRLGELQTGDRVEVTDVAGTVFGYVVTSVQDYPKAAFPTRDVFGATPDDQLRLITCGGVFDSAAASYVDNRVVYAVRDDS